MKLYLPFVKRRPCRKDGPAQQPGREMFPLLRVPTGAALFHISHWKAATTWIRGILVDAFGAEVLPRTYFEAQGLDSPIEPGKVYAGVCYSKEAFECLNRPLDTRRFVVIRDLRDTLISAYFSLKNSHPSKPPIIYYRRILGRLNQEDGLCYLARSWLLQSTLIQRTWLTAGEPCIRYEDITADPMRHFEKLFATQLRVSVERSWLEKLVARHAFSRYSGGREPGVEDANSHFRKGIAGDWRRHFTPKVTECFKAMHNDVLVMAGYEKSESW